LITGLTLSIATGATASSVTLTDNIPDALSRTVPVVCERAMYFDYNGWDSGSCGMGFAQ
jgi:hypothetical protein